MINLISQSRANWAREKNFEIAFILIDYDQFRQTEIETKALSLIANGSNVHSFGHDRVNYYARL